MGKYLKKFQTTAQYNAYTADTANFIKPNVSLITETNTVEYNPYVEPIETRVVAKYNVTESTMSQKILGHIFIGSATAVTTAFTSVYVDGNEIEISDANVNYTFDTVGEHTVRYELKDPTTINASAFNGVNMGAPPTGVKAILITIPDSVTSIGGNAFGYCTGLTSIVIPDSVTSIGTYAFQSCSGLTNIDIPDSVTSISNQAFQNCSGMTSCTIGSGITSISEAAFKNCRSLTSITVNATTPPTLGTTVFDNTNDCPIYVPSGSVDTYKAASGWSTYASRIQAIP